MHFHLQLNYQSKTNTLMQVRRSFRIAKLKVFDDFMKICPKLIFIGSAKIFCNWIPLNSNNKNHNARSRTSGAIPNFSMWPRVARENLFRQLQWTVVELLHFILPSARLIDADWLVYHQRLIGLRQRQFGRIQSLSLQSKFKEHILRSRIFFRLAFFFSFFCCGPPLHILLSVVHLLEFLRQFLLLLFVVSLCPSCFQEFVVLLFI